MEITLNKSSYGLVQSFKMNIGDQLVKTGNSWHQLIEETREHIIKDKMFLIMEAILNSEYNEEMDCNHFDFRLSMNTLNKLVYRLPLKVINKIKEESIAYEGFSSIYFELEKSEKYIVGFIIEKNKVYQRVFSFDNLTQRVSLIGDIENLHHIVQQVVKVSN